MKKYLSFALILIFTFVFASSIWFDQLRGVTFYTISAATDVGFLRMPKTAKKLTA